MYFTHSLPQVSTVIALTKISLSTLWWNLHLLFHHFIFISPFLFFFSVLVTSTRTLFLLLLVLLSYVSPLEVSFSNAGSLFLSLLYSQCLERVLPRDGSVSQSVRSVQSLCRVWRFVIAWTAAHQASLSITKSRSLLRLMCIESVTPRMGSHWILRQ